MQLRYFVLLVARPAIIKIKLNKLRTTSNKLEKNNRKKHAIKKTSAHHGDQERAVPRNSITVLHRVGSCSGRVSKVINNEL